MESVSYDNNSIHEVVKASMMLKEIILNLMCIEDNDESKKILI